ncbi:CHAT domain-containing tetratricopeptide repeat protein [uncultured Aquimarina sp.]|uniref:CHAT domain-containing protein n=1 Tax=uncultured Aquimarina sp. TaxID=575652 RepID=UPI00263512BE|nr:CHAT domain-containing tetratricopeptide repeat protein [uncultured Aquimarina sp.]
MTPLKTIVFLLFFTSLSFSQTKTVNDTILAFQYFKKADSLLTVRKLDSSIVYFKKALPIYEKAQAWERVAGCYNRISVGYLKNSNNEKSLSNANKALSISSKYLPKVNKQKANALTNIGGYYELGAFKFYDAIKYYQEALEIRLGFLSENHLDIAKNHEDLGHVYFQVNEFEKALFSFKRVRDIRLKLLGMNDLKTANTYNNIAAVYNELGDHEKAIENFEEDLRIGLEILGKNDNSIAYSYNNLGTLFEKRNELKKAQEYYKKALDIFISNEEKIGIVGVYNNIGFNYEKKREYDQALFYYQKSLNEAQKFLDKNHPYIVFLTSNIGAANYHLKNFDIAFEFQQKALDLGLKIYKKNHSEIADIYREIAKINEAVEEFDSAIENYRTALDINQEVLGKSNYQNAQDYNNIARVFIKKYDYPRSLFNYQKAKKANYQKKSSLSPIFLLTTLEGEALVFKKQYQISNDKIVLKNSINNFKKLDSLVSYLRGTLSNYEDKVAFSKKAKEIYKSAIETHISFFDQNPNSLEKAFYYSEKSKSNTLKDLLNDSNAKSFSGLSTDLVDLEKKLRINKAFYQSQINEEFSKKESNSTKVTGYENKLFNISRRQDSLTKVLEKNYTKYYQLKYNNKVISAADIQQKLDKKTTLLEFFTADSITYAFTISKSNFAIKELSTPKLEEQIERFRASMTKNYKEQKESSYLLYQRLIAPVKDELIGNQLIIVPDGPLWHLNFDLLLMKEDASNNPKNWSYLLKDYAISYANSATLLFGNEDQKANSKEDQECLAFSFSSGDNNTSTTRNVSLKTFRNSSMDLPGTREEIKAIANIVDGQYFYGSEATEENFKKHAGAYNILHLALHGDLDNERPENSRLYFTKSKDTVQDNYLYSHELFALDISAELTVLSACNTGTGKIAKGEGIMSLGNAFQYAGTKSLLLTNWEVSDETTPRIMEYFYTNLKEGKNKAEALQQAKLQFLATTNEETCHPYYWGGFYLLGDTTVIQFKDNNYIYWWVGIGILALILLSLFWYRRNLNHAGFK